MLLLPGITYYYWSTIKLLTAVNELEVQGMTFIFLVLSSMHDNTKSVMQTNQCHYHCFSRQCSLYDSMFRSILLIEMLIIRVVSI